MIVFIFLVIFGIWKGIFGIKKKLYLFYLYIINISYCSVLIFFICFFYRYFFFWYFVIVVDVVLGFDVGFFIRE